MRCEGLVKRQGWPAPTNIRKWGLPGDARTRSSIAGQTLARDDWTLVDVAFNQLRAGRSREPRTCPEGCREPPLGRRQRRADAPRTGPLANDKSIPPRCGGAPRAPDGLTSQNN